MKMRCMIFFLRGKTLAKTGAFRLFPALRLPRIGFSFSYRKQLRRVGALVFLSSWKKLVSIFWKCIQGVLT